MPELPTHTREPLDEGGFIAHFEDGLVLRFEIHDDRLAADTANVDAMLLNAYVEARA